MGMEWRANRSDWAYYGVLIEIAASKKSIAMKNICHVPMAKATNEAGRDDREPGHINVIMVQAEIVTKSRR